MGEEYSGQGSRPFPLALLGPPGRQLYRHMGAGGGGGSRNCSFSLLSSLSFLWAPTSPSVRYTQVHVPSCLAIIKALALYGCAQGGHQNR